MFTHSVRRYAQGPAGRVAGRRRLALIVAIVVTPLGSWIARTGTARTGTARPLAPRTRRGGLTERTPAQKGARAAQSLTLEQLAGQRVIYAYAGRRPPAVLLSAIRAGEAAGVILFGPNISSTRQLGAVIRELRRAAASSPVKAPLLLMTDQEGGEVRRLPGPPALSEGAIGERPDRIALAAAAGRGAAQTLSAAGLNVNLAPVLDVYRQRGNFIDEYRRSYSANGRTVAAVGQAFISAQQTGRVAATGKHFPGLGAATVAENTDLAPVTVPTPAAQLRAIDERPYGSAIAAGAKLVMTSWATYPALDPRRPAGLSTRIIAGELRGRLGFRGVVVTDAIGAGALAPYGALAHRGMLAAAAGADLVLCSVSNPNDNTPADGVAVREAIAAALNDGRLSRVGAAQAAARVLALREHP